MNECCTNDNPSGSQLKKYRCPVNGKFYPNVKMSTLMQHIINPWEANLIPQEYFFCDDPDCDVVYFGRNDVTINKNQIRTPIWQKESGRNSEVCYCFGATHEQVEENKDIIEFIIEKTKNGQCSCESRNPSGHCCLKNFSKH